MKERCGWPKCRQPTACTFSLDGETWHLCDYHGDLVQDEDEKVLKRARKKIGMPFPIPKERPPEVAETPQEVDDDADTDFSEFEKRLASGSYDWEGD